MEASHSNSPATTTHVCDWQFCPRPGFHDDTTGPHVWTIPEIKALPQFGDAMGWFYGLVECDGGEGVEVAEIYPGMGWTSIDPEDVAKCWDQMARDMRNYRAEGQQP